MELKQRSSCCFAHRFFPRHGLLWNENLLFNLYTPLSQFDATNKYDNNLSLRLALSSLSIDFVSDFTFNSYLILCWFSNHLCIHSTYWPSVKFCYKGYICNQDNKVTLWCQKCLQMAEIMEWNNVNESASHWKMKHQMLPPKWFSSFISGFKAITLSVKNDLCPNWVYVDKSELFKPLSSNGIHLTNTAQ